MSQHVDATGPDALSIITHGTRACSGATTTSTVSPAVDPSTVVGTLGDLGIAITNAIDAFEADADVLEPGEVRVGIDSLCPLLEEYDHRQVFKFLHLINGRTQEADGIAHSHLPVERDARIVPALSLLFDIVIQVREHDGDYQERWIINDGADSSGWLSERPE